MVIAAPALPLDEAGEYVAGAYVVFVALLLVYVAIMSARLARIDRELAELAELAEQGRRDTSPGSPPGVSRSEATRELEESVTGESGG
jgi:Flp pilus assembly protein TadB